MNRITTLARALPLREFAGFATLPLLSVATPLVALPILARTLTLGEWAALAVGQAVGGLGAILISYGYAVTGPAQVATAREAERKRLWVESFLVRLAVAAVATPIVIAVAAGLGSDGEKWLCVAVAVMASGMGFSTAFFAIGSGSPKLLVLSDTIPRAIGNLAGAGLVSVTGNPYWYPGVLFFANVVPSAVMTVSCLRSSLRGDGFDFAGSLKRNVAAMLTEVSAGSYTVASSALVASGAGVSASVVAEFNAAERLTRVGASSIVVTGNALQGWVARGLGSSYGSRVRFAGLVHGLVGLSGMVFLGLLGPAVTELLFGAQLGVGSSTAWAFGVFFFFWSMETVTARHVLAAVGRTRELLLTTVIGSLAGVALIPVGADQFGSDGAAWALAATAGLIVLMQTPIVLSELGKH